MTQARRRHFCWGKGTSIPDVRVTTGCIDCVVQGWRHSSGFNRINSLWFRRPADLYENEHSVYVYGHGTRERHPGRSR